MFNIDAQKRPTKTWITGRIIGSKAPLNAKNIWELRTRLAFDHRNRDLALFNLTVDSKLRGGDPVKLRLGGIIVGTAFRTR